MLVADECTNSSITDATTEDLYLLGDKIKLESRPTSREMATASGRCAHFLQGPQRSSRPVSAIPMLMLRPHKDDDYTQTQKVRRPVSADSHNVIRSQSERVHLDEINSVGADTIANSFSNHHNIEDFDAKSLPSSALLESIIDEPFSLPLTQSEIIETTNAIGVLTPGLESKPPLPPVATGSKYPAPRPIAAADHTQSNLLNIELVEDLDDSEDTHSTQLDETSYTTRMADAKSPTLRKSKQRDLGVVSRSVDAVTKTGKAQKVVESLTHQDAAEGTSDGTMEDSKTIELSEKKSPILQRRCERRATATYRHYVKCLKSPKKTSTDVSTKVESPIGKCKTPFRPAKHVRYAKNDSDENIHVREIDDTESWMTKASIQPCSLSASDLIAISTTKNTIEKTVSISPSRGTNNLSTSMEIETIFEALEKETEMSFTQIQSIKSMVSHEMHASINTAPMKSLASGGDVPLHDAAGRSAQSKDERKKSSQYTAMLNYLEEMEQNEQQMSRSSQRSDQSSVTTKSLRLDTVPKLEDLLNFSQMELANEVITLNVHVKDKLCSISSLQEELSQLREQAMLVQKQTERLIRDKLNTQKNESELVIKRHQKFIDQLMTDKKALNEQCEGLLREIKTLDERFSSNITALQHKHSVELKKAKDMSAASEKMRRERWLDSKTQKIKELTAKSIEPELNAMSTRHESELSQLRDRHKREIEDIEMQNARKVQQQLQTLRHELNEQHRAELTRERERHQSMLENERISAAEQRKRLTADHNMERSQLEQREKSICSQRDQVVAKVREEYKQMIVDMQMKFNREREEKQERETIDRESWKKSMMKAMEKSYSQRVDGLLAQCKRERDTEIENVIEHLESEMQVSKEQLENSSEARIRRLKEQHEIEVQELVKSQQLLKDKLVKANETSSALQKAVKISEASMKQLSDEHFKAQQMNEQLVSEKAQLKNVLRLEMNEDMQRAIDERDQVHRTQENEFVHVFNKIKMVIVRKDDLISELNCENTALKNKCKYLESMLDEKRKKLLLP